MLYDTSFTGYAITCLSSRLIAPSTIARKVHSISKQLGVLVQVGYRKDNPVEQLKSIKKNLIPKQVRRIDQPPTVQDLYAIRELKNNKTALLIDLLYTTGARISEILDIKKNDIKKHNETTSKASIIGKGNKARMLFIANSLLERIQETYNLDSEYLIHTDAGSQSKRTTEHMRIKALIKQVIGKDAHLHQLRHLYATTQIVSNKKS